jgi:hypothetical protein
MAMSCNYHAEPHLGVIQHFSFCNSWLPTNCGDIGELEKRKLFMWSILILQAQKQSRKLFMLDIILSMYIYDFCKDKWSITDFLGPKQ